MKKKKARKSTKKSLFQKLNKKVQAIIIASDAGYLIRDIKTGEVYTYLKLPDLVFEKPQRFEIVDE